MFCIQFTDSLDFKLLKRNQKREHRIEHPSKFVNLFTNSTNAYKA